MARAAADRVAFWRGLIARQAASRLSVGEVCRRAGVSTAAFYAWRRRLNSAAGAASTVCESRPALVPVRVIADDGGGEITIELRDAPTQASATYASATYGTATQPVLRVSIPPGCDETSIRRVLCAALGAVKSAARNEVASGATRVREGRSSC
jgi:transposase-like protein